MSLDCDSCFLSFFSFRYICDDPSNPAFLRDRFEHLPLTGICHGLTAKNRCSIDQPVKRM